MNSFTKITLMSLVAVGVSNAATLSFTNSGLGSFATGFGDTSGGITSGLIWGIVVDTTGDGFASSTWNSGFTYSGGNTTGIAFTTTTGSLTDDVLYLNTSLTTSLSTAADSAIAGTGRVNSITSATYGAALGYGGAVGTSPNVGGNQKFAIIWFDRGIALGSTSTNGQKFGLATAGTNAAPLFTTPAANGDTIDYSAAFTGADPAKLTTFSLQGIPEPSTSLLGVVGALGLLRRRRN